MKAEYTGNGGCLQRDSTECKEYAGARSVVPPEREEMAGREPDLLEKVLDRDNLNRAYKRVKANKGAPGVDGMTVEEALPWLKEHGKELTDSIRQGKYKPDPVRRKEIPKPDGGVRKLGIPSVKDRIVQQGIAQVLQYPGGLRVHTLCQMLNAPYTERYVRCGERTGVSHPLLLD